MNETNDSSKHISAADALKKVDALVLSTYRPDIQLETSSENHRIATCMAEQASRQLRIFSRDLDPLIYDQQNFVDACKKLALRSRFSEIKILAFNSQRISQRGHRLLSLVRTLSSRMQIRRPDKQFEDQIQAFMTVDESGFMHRKNAERFEGIANFHNPRETRELNRLFDKIWERSQVDTELRSLNI